MSRSHDDTKKKASPCGYCNGERTVIREDGPFTEKEIGNFKIGFSTTKMRNKDYEHLLNMGFARCGTYVY